MTFKEAIEKMKQCLPEDQYFSIQPDYTRFADGKVSLIYFVYTAVEGKSWCERSGNLEDAVQKVLDAWKADQLDQISDGLAEVENMPFDGAF